MNKRIPIGILLTTWMVSLFFLLLLPRTVEGATISDGRSHLQISKVFVSDLGSLPESPSLEFDLKYFATPALTSSPFLFWKSSLAGACESRYSTAPLFDVKQTFRHFFFTW